MAKFRVGDKVRTVNTGKIYRTYADFIHEVLPEKSHLWRSGRGIDTRLVYTVLASHAHLTNPWDEMLYIVENPEKTAVYIIGEAGLELVEPVLPRICYLLGGDETPLEIRELFEIEGYNSNPCYIHESGILYNRHRVCVGSDWLYYILNHPERIIRKPKLTFTEDEKAFLRLYAGAGYLWIARESDGVLLAWQNEPTKDQDEDFSATGEACILPESLLPTITFENSPVYISDYVGVNGND